MQAASDLRGAIRVALGEQMVSTRMPVYLDGNSAFVAVETKRKGYRFEKNGQEITIRRVDPWAIVTGLPPLYYFKGDLRYEADGTIMNGSILMSTLPKYFILTWAGAVVIAFLATLIWAMVLASQFMIFPSTVGKGDLTTAGFLIGGILGLGFFGTLVIAVTRSISRGQRQKLIMFARGVTRS
jgi:hypothetical protein